ncbi:hypothetical protein [Endozoicomonas sp. 4G]|uniref:hypothetical protein n=1 Tax=Endozoicomonas sp. 4G TaxID=2872754 RepID=UPI002078B8A7|nr:hypothetical protein [Endozoicomonas sp. 4G]
MYMTEAHQLPPSHILRDGLRHPVAPLIRREDIHRLASLGVLRHITAEGPAPLGYGPWHLAEDAQGPHYYREPAGTEQERQAAIDAAAAAAHEAALAAEWAQQAADRAKREANEALAEPTTPENLSQQLAAIRLLSGV